jgi:epoxyqueuosine reductase QueG
VNGSFQNLHYAATVGLRLSDAIIDEITDKPTFTYFHHYRTVNSLLDLITLHGLLFIQKSGYNAVAVPASQTVNHLEDPYSGIFPHKTAAVMAGLGRIGKNGLFIHDAFGPRVRLATILTDMELPCTKPALTEQTAQASQAQASQTGGCQSCDRCVKACPAMALTGNVWYEGVAREEIVDAKACSDYMNKNFKHIGRGSVCGIYVKVCPAHVNI